MALSAVDSGLAGCRTPESKRSSFERNLVSVGPLDFFFQSGGAARFLFKVMCSCLGRVVLVVLVRRLLSIIYILVSSLFFLLS